MSFAEVECDIQEDTEMHKLVTQNDARSDCVWTDETKVTYYSYWLQQRVEWLFYTLNMA